MNFKEMKKKIIIIDDHQIICDGLKAIFKKSDQYEVIADFDNELALFAFLGEEQADIILMDIDLPTGNGIDITRKAKMQYPAIKIIMHTMSNEPYTILLAKQSGADGYVLKYEGQKALELAMEQNYYDTNSMIH
jgi:DNA-binding NarL/FixJ family response regulator